MAYEVIDEDLKVEACEIGDLTLSQIESFLRLRGDGEKIETLTLFSRQDGTIVLNKNHPGYKDFKDFTLSYLQLEDSEREKLDQLEGIKEAAAVIDRAIEQRRDAAVLDILHTAVVAECHIIHCRRYLKSMIAVRLVCVRFSLMA